MKSRELQIQGKVVLKDKKNNGEGRNHKEQKRKSYALDLTAVMLSHKIKFQLGLLYKMSKGGKRFLNSVQNTMIQK